MAESAAPDTPDAVAPPPGNRRFPLLDGMRALAVLSVLVVHVVFFAIEQGVPGDRFLSHLNVGVTIFFLISGFLLYRPFIAHRTGGGEGPPIGEYALRRALRIFPAYWLVLTVLTLLPGVVGVSGGEWLSQYALLFTFPTDNPASCADLAFECGLSQTWSLVVELTFYAALPLWFLFAERLARGRPTRQWVAIELVGLGVLALASVLIAFSGDVQATGSLVGGTLIGYMLWFALGMGMAVVSVAIEGRSAPRAIELIARHPTPLWVAALGVYVALCFRINPGVFIFERVEALLAHLAFGLVALLLMLPAVFGDDRGGIPRRILANPLVAWIGLISYGIFLWHYVVALELGFDVTTGEEGLSFWPLLGATLAISIAAAAISYYALERPILRLKHRPGAKR